MIPGMFAVAARHTPAPPVGDFVTITVPAQAAALSGFPVYVDLSDMPPGFWSALAYPDGRDIRVTDTSDIGIPFDLVVCSPEAEKGSLFVRADLSDVASMAFRIHFGDPLNDFVPPDAPNGREAVWADYDCVYTMGDSFFDRAGKCPDLIPLGAVYGLLQTNTSPNLGVHQGIAWDGEHYYAIGTNELKKYTAGFSLVTTNSDPCGDVGFGVNHCGDAEVVDGILYVPIETFTSPNGHANSRIALFDTSDLSFITSYPVAYASGVATGVDMAGCAFNSADGYLYFCAWSDGSRLWKWDMIAHEFVGTLELSAPQAQAQGLTFWRGDIYINRDDVDATIQVGRDGTVRGMVWGITGGSYEGITHSDDALLVLHDPSMNAGVVRRLESRPVAAEAGSFFSGSGNYRVDGVPHRPTWTIGATAQTLISGSTPIVASYNVTGSTNNAHRAALGRRSTNLWGVWDSSATWLNNSTNPGISRSYRLHMQYNGSSSRNLAVDGVSFGPQAISSARPAAGASHSLIIGASDHSNFERFNGYIGFVYLRPEILSPEWIATEAVNLASPESFYSVS